MKNASGASVLSAAIGLAMAMQATPTSAAGSENHPAVLDLTPQQSNKMVQDQMMKFIKHKMEKEHLEMCYGINAAGKNDCGTAAHSCHGQATEARDPKSFVLVPTGLCTKISGGKLNPA